MVELEAIFFKNVSIFTKSLSVKEPMPFQYCEKFPLEYLQKLFLRMRIYHSLKFANRDFQTTKKETGQKIFEGVTSLTLFDVFLSDSNYFEHWKLTLAI